jgi:hypothetical protein
MAWLVQPHAARRRYPFASTACESSRCGIDPTLDAYAACPRCEKKSPHVNAKTGQFLPFLYDNGPDSDIKGKGRTQNVLLWQGTRNENPHIHGYICLKCVSDNNLWTSVASDRESVKRKCIEKGGIVTDLVGFDELQTNTTNDLIVAFYGLTDQLKSAEGDVLLSCGIYRELCRVLYHMTTGRKNTEGSLSLLQSSEIFRVHIMVLCVVNHIYKTMCMNTESLPLSRDQHYAALRLHVYVCRFFNTHYRADLYGVQKLMGEFDSHRFILTPENEYFLSLHDNFHGTFVCCCFCRC